MSDESDSDVVYQGLEPEPEPEPGSQSESESESESGSGSESESQSNTANDHKDMDINDNDADNDAEESFPDAEVIKIGQTIAAADFFGTFQKANQDDFEHFHPAFHRDLGEGTCLIDFANYKCTVRDLSEHVLNDMLSLLYETCVAKPEDQTVKEHCHKLLGVGIGELIDGPALLVRYRQALLIVQTLYANLVRKHMVGNASATKQENQRKIGKILEIFLQSLEWIDMERKLESAMSVTQRYEGPDMIQLYRYHPLTQMSKYSDLQKLLVFLLQQLYIKGYRRKGENCMRQILTSAKQPTHAWETACTISQFIHSVVNKEANNEMWRCLTSGENARRAEKYLLTHTDFEFPDLVIDRRKYAFRNGWLLLGAMHHTAGQDCIELPTFVPYQDDEKARFMPSARAAVKFFDREFDQSLFDRLFEKPDPIPGKPDVKEPENPEDPNDPYAYWQTNWYTKIDSKPLDNILEYQDLPDEVCRIMYAFLGRMNYAVNEMDRWEAMPFIKGVAQCGKSTILRIPAMWYNADDVGVMAANMERKFGLQNFVDSLILLCYEVRNNMTLDQGEYQNMVSGEPMTIPVKGKSAHKMVWQAPMMWAGNQVPPFVDAGGSIGRRVVVFIFSKPVKEVNMSLFRTLSDITPSLLLKCNLAYLALLKKVGTKGLWQPGVLPDYFSKTRSALTREVSPLDHFLENGELNSHPDVCIPLQEFNTLYQAHCRAHQIKPVSLTDDYLALPLLKYGAKVTPTAETRQYGGTKEHPAYVRQKWVIGLGTQAMWGEVFERANEEEAQIIEKAKAALSSESRNESIKRVKSGDATLVPIRSPALAVASG